MSRSAWYKPAGGKNKQDQEVIDALNGIVSKHRRWGFWKCHYRLRALGKPWNHKRVHRVYCAMNLNLPRRTKKRIPRREPQPLEVVEIPDKMWSMDFMHDSLYQGRCFRTLNIIDEGVREALAIEIDTSLPAARVIRVLEQLEERRGLPEQIRVDNGPEFTSELLSNWSRQKGIRLHYIQPGKPTQNAYIERFNKTFRYEFLDSHLFEDLDQVRELAWEWMIGYNEERPHQSLGNLTPTEFYKQKLSA